MYAVIEERLNLMVAKVNLKCTFATTSLGALVKVT